MGGVDGPSTGGDIDDDTIYIGEDYPSSAAVVSASSEALDAHLVEQGNYEDHEEILDRIQGLEDDNVQVDYAEGIVADGDKRFCRKRSTRIGVALVVRACCRGGGGHCGWCGGGNQRY